MSDDHGVGVCSTSNTFNVADDRLRCGANAKAALMGPPTEVHVFGEHEVRLIKPAERLKTRPANHKKCPRDPINSSVRPQRRGSIPTSEGVVLREEPEQGMASGVERIRKPTN